MNFTGLEGVWSKAGIDTSIPAKNHAIRKQQAATCPVVGCSCQCLVWLRRISVLVLTLLEVKWGETMWPMPAPAGVFHAHYLWFFPNPILYSFLLFHIVGIVSLRKLASVHRDVHNPSSGIVFLVSYWLKLFSFLLVEREQ